MWPTSCRSESAGDAADARTDRIRPWLWLAGWSCAAAVIWLTVLPWFGARPAIQRHIEFLEQRRIDPSAMFYTELEIMDEVQARMARLRRQHAACFWGPGVPDDRPFPEPCCE